MTTITSSRASTDYLRRERRAAWILVGPVVVLYFLFFALPLLLALVESVMATRLSGLGLDGGVRTFVGIDNYRAVLTDPAILDGFGRVLLIGVIQVPVMMILATFMALLFDSGMVWLRSIFQTVSFLPHAIPGVIAALIWGALYLPQISPIVRLLRDWGSAFDFLAEDVVLFSIMNMTTWSWTGYNMIIIYAALQSVPRELFEAARMDGASAFTVALRIKLPLIVPALAITVAFSIIGSLQQFADPAVLMSFTNSIDSRFTPNLAVYSLGTAEGSPGPAAALSVVIALLAFVLSIGVLTLRDRTEDKR
ncbi:carbohydrate ABC transporter permease [Brachybacterium paraconglomeratum]|uniref:carbohydrate ABC transporter permease n=1 Tax=Brachybacterium paraconglomeratum TaxID=173362 RepID=UPI003FD3DFA1